MDAAYLAMNFYYMDVAMSGYGIYAMNFYYMEDAMYGYGSKSYGLLLYGGRDVLIQHI